MDQLREQKKQSFFQNEVKEKSYEQGNVLSTRQEMSFSGAFYVSDVEKTKDKAFFTEDPRTEEVISKVKEKKLTRKDRNNILEDDRKFRTKAGISL